MKNIIKQIKRVLVTLLIFGATLSSIAQQQNWLSVSGNKLFDSEGKEVRLTGVNWFGFETSLYSPHGIWTRDMKSVLRQIKDLGFNTIRVPWCNEMLNPGSTININSFGTDPYTGISPMNEEESKLTTPIELMDAMVQWCQDNDIKIVLDNHSRAADGFLNEALWYTNVYSENRWINDWIFIAERYKDFSAVVAMDLNNEPHGSTWGNSNPATDWNKAAERCGNAILEVNPNVLIIVEGVGEFEGNSYWWGGQLMGARKYPIQLSNQNKLMYSAHEYGPEVFNQDWFGAANFPQNMPGIWQENFHYLYEEEISPIFAGEFGIRNQGAFGGTAYTWFTEWMNFMGDIYSWTFWTMNPNSGDTGGILKDDWFSVNQWKMDVLRPHFAPLIPNIVGENLPPTARFTNDVSSGDAPLTVQFDASDSSDPENDPLSYSWDFGDGTTATGIATSHTFTNVDTYSVTLTVSDTAGNNSISTGIIIVTEPGNGDPCDFGTPLANPLPSITNATYTKVHILGINGPDLSNMASFSVNWDLPNNGLWQLSMNTTNGIPNWWNDLKSKITSQNLNTSSPSITLSDTGFPNLDDSYYVTLDDQNFVLVSKSRNVTIYFSNSDVAPICKEEVNEKKVLNQLKVYIFPNPVLDKIMIQVEPSMNGLPIHIVDVKGKVIKNGTLNPIFGMTTIDISECIPGLYFMKIPYEKGIITKQIIKK